MSGRDGTPARLIALGGLLALQAALLGWALASPETMPPGAQPAVVALALVSALLLALDARARSHRDTGSWWRPDWIRWGAGSVLPGANAGVFLAYLLRTRQVRRRSEPTGYWKRPLVAGVVVVTLWHVVSAAPQSIPPAVEATILVGVLAVVGFTVVAAYYDIQYVALSREVAGRDWLVGGHYWLLPLGVPFPGRVFFLAIYVFRRRIMLGRIASGADVESLPTGVGATDADGDGEDTDGGQPTLPTETRQE